jgi:hypothetical protein
MSFWEEVGNAGFGLFSRIQEGQRQNDAMQANAAMNRQSANNQLELLDKSYPLVSGAYKDKLIADNQANRLNTFMRIAESPKQFKYWD